MSPKKMRRFLLYIVVAGVGYSIYNPGIIDYPPLQDRAKQANEVIGKILQNIDTEKAKNSAGKVLGDAVSIAKNSPFKENFKDVPDEIVVDELMKEIQQKISSLPEEKAREVVVQYCYDFIEESTKSGKEDDAE